MDEGRSQKFARDNRLMDALTELNTLLGAIELPVNTKPQYPMVFVVGCPRSGTTLMMQWLASLGVFAYPSNLIARFYANPYVGVRIQQVLHAFDSKKQIFPTASEDAFASSYGHTTGALAPSEYWYFWRRFFQFDDIQVIADFNSHRHNTKDFVNELGLMEQAFAMPLAMKALILNWNLPDLYHLFDKCLFINVSRSAVDNAESLYIARKDFFNDVNKWYSFKPPEYTWLKDCSPLEQVAGQVHFTCDAVDCGLASLPKTSVLSVAYEDFCVSPEKTYTELTKKMAELGYEMPHYSGQKNFQKPQGRSRLLESERSAIEEYLIKLKNNSLVKGSSK